MHFISMHKVRNKDFALNSLSCTCRIVRGGVYEGQWLCGMLLEPLKSVVLGLQMHCTTPTCTWGTGMETHILMLAPDPRSHPLRARLACCLKTLQHDSHSACTSPVYGSAPHTSWTLALMDSIAEASMFVLMALDK